ncbi:MAG: RdgB/HAM1 family non-canonical purine NTP pyrophosphatase [Epsilonproteobacteria bacterium]|nr:RdgB/HAM1 family non-canonical purine NTP pyrophosphatase [Campylobacterota bacterium]
MKLILASGNKGKIREFKEILDEDIIPFKEVVGDIKIIENGSTFAQNALIKARTIYNLLKDDSIVISDDSGISVPLLNNEPGIYSARYAKEGASDRENLEKLINKLRENNIVSTKAHYTAAIAIVSKLGEYVVHGWMHGIVINEARGDKGFGYDPIFIPNGYDKTLGELNSNIKAKISHRFKAIKLTKGIIEILKRYLRDR